MKKRFAIALTLFTALSLAAGCSSTGTPASQQPQSSAATGTPEEKNFNETGYPIVNEPITLTIAGAMNSLATTWEGALQLTYLTELTGINFEPRGYSSDAWKDQKGLMFASNTLPDLFISAGFTQAELLQYGSGGQLLALNDLTDKYGVNLKTALEQYPAAKAGMTSGNGSIYTLPLISPVTRDMHNRYWVNEKWLSNLGLKVPETLDELYAVLKAFKEQDANGNGDANDEIPLSFVSGSTIDGLILNALGINYNANDAQFGVTADAEGKVYCVQTSEAYKEYLQYMNRLYTEGLLDNEVFIQTDEMLSAKAEKNLIGVASVSAMYITAGTELGYDYTQFDALTSNLSTTKMVTASPGFSVGGVAISAANPYPEATVRLLDYFYSEEGGQVSYVGAEGVGWNWIDKAAGTWDKAQPEGYESAENFRWMKNIIGSWCGWQRKEFNAGQGSSNALWLNEMSAEFSEPYFVTRFPSLSLSEEDTKTVSALTADLNNYSQQSRARFIVGEENIETGWAAYVESMNKMGAQTYADIYQTYYDTYLSLID